jgi:hypothetical protein
MPIPVPVSFRKQIADTAVTYLSAATSANGWTKPTGLTAHRERTRQLEKESLPVIVVYFEDESPKPIGEHYKAPLTERDLGLMLDIRALVPSGSSPDDVLDPLTTWAIYQIFSQESFGGMANGAEEIKTMWYTREGDVVIAQATILMRVKYRTSRIDPSSKS